MRYLKLLLAIVIISTVSCGGSTGTTTTGGGGGGGTTTGVPTGNTSVEDGLLALFNAERVAAGLPALVRNTILDRIELWFVNDMATNMYLSHTDTNGRSASNRVDYYTGDTTTNCSEIIQWWGGTASAQVHYDGYFASTEHHNAYMEQGIYNLGPTTICGIAVLDGTGPVGSSFAGNSGSYSSMIICNQAPAALAIDPFSE